MPDYANQPPLNGPWNRAFVPPPAPSPVARIVVAIASVLIAFMLLAAVVVGGTLYFAWHTVRAGVEVAADHRGGVEVRANAPGASSTISVDSEDSDEGNAAARQVRVLTAPSATMTWTVTTTTGAPVRVESDATGTSVLVDGLPRVRIVNGQATALDGAVVLGGPGGYVVRYTRPDGTAAQFTLSPGHS